MPKCWALKSYGESGVTADGSTAVRYEKFFKTASGKQKALEKKNADLADALEESQKQSTLKKLQEARLQSDYERVTAILDRIPKEVLAAYTHRTNVQKHDKKFDR